ncbi:MAG: type IV pilus biogenesis/stability protein PilW [Halioglobus sp.]|nr:type IV pilus biogenesis/stability protein PilW [Halioglobus sp.]
MMDRVQGIDILTIKTLSLFLSLLLLGGCITETTGGYTEKADAQKALQERVSLARQYIGEHNWEAAKRNLQLATEIDGNNAEVAEAFALVYQQTGEFELAEESFKRSIRLDRNCSRCRNNYAAFLFSQERYKEADKQLEIVVKDTLYSGRPNAFVNLGLCRLKLFDTQGAEEAFVRALSMDRTNPIALLELARIRYEDQDYAKASQHYNAYKSVVRQQPAAGLLLGIQLAQANGDRDAEASYALALGSRFPNSPEYQSYRRSIPRD